ncbi:NAD(P)H-hydrate dehydratase [Hyphobacterium sp.]|uniref:NAD(P)H-hydrate dehydratase n=1 Tax=Hyphobacterium sp. TaxID=2004662 RepID=UPI003BA8C104
MDNHRAADAFATANGVPGIDLMEAAGRAVAAEIMRRWSARKTIVLCGPGNNGGDGFVAARHLANAGWPVEVATLGDPQDDRGDAAVMRGRWKGSTHRLDQLDPPRFGLFVDALFGAGLTRPLEGAPAKWAVSLADLDRPVVAVDIPSGLHGDRGKPPGEAFPADLTVTFHRLKPAHVLQPGREMCGQIVLADIGIPSGWDTHAAPVAELNDPAVWTQHPLSGPADIHKHRKGRLCVVSGGPSSTGAARLAALSGLRAGAGLVTILTPAAAMQVNALHTTAVMIARFDDTQGFLDALDNRRATAVLIGPGNGVGAETRDRVIAASAREAGLVLDADALTSFADEPDHLFAHLRTDDVLTPHEGEFARLFPDFAADDGLNKIERARAAAKRAGSVLVLKGADTVIASADGAVRVNVHASPALATAGTGDVLAGLVGGFLAHGLNGFEAASIAVWLHGEAGLRRGRGLIAEDLPAAIPEALQALDRRMRIRAARQSLLSNPNSA